MDSIQVHSYTTHSASHLETLDFECVLSHTHKRAYELSISHNAAAYVCSFSVSMKCVLVVSQIESVNEMVVFPL